MTDRVVMGHPGSMSGGSVADTWAESSSDEAHSGLDPVWWTFVMRRAETRENVDDDSASETLLYARVQSTHGELVRTSGKSVGEICRDLDLTETAVRRWLAQADIDAGRRDGLTTAEREELSRLRRENRVLRDERDTLKKAAAFFAKESTR